MANYNNLLELGAQFQDYCTSVLMTKGIIIMPFSSRKYQYEVGESASKHEIKYDMKFSETGNLYFETAERSDINKSFVDSGIYRKDNTLFVIIGDKDNFFMFHKKQLQNFFESTKQNVKKFREVNTGTSKGFVIPPSNISELILFHYNLETNEIYDTYNSDILPDELYNKIIDSASKLR